MTGRHAHAYCPADGQYAVAVADLTPSPPPQRRRYNRGLVLIGALLVGVGFVVTTIVVTHGSRSGASGVATTPAAATPPSTTGPVASISTAETAPLPLVGSPNAKAPAPPAPSKYGIPNRLIIPAIGVNTSLQSLGLSQLTARCKPRRSGRWLVGTTKASGPATRARP